MPMIMNSPKRNGKCKFCGEPFVTRSRTKKFCSDACSKTFHRKKLKQSRKYVRENSPEGRAKALLRTHYETQGYIVTRVTYKSHSGGFSVAFKDGKGPHNLESVHCNWPKEIEK